MRARVSAGGLPGGVGSAVPGGALPGGFPGGVGQQQGQSVPGA